MRRIEVEVDSDTNRNLFFFPADTLVRGRFSHSRLGRREPAAMAHVHSWGDGIPGQVIGYDPEKREGYIHEPLRDSQHAHLRERIESRGYRLPEDETFPLADGGAVATWLYWLKRHVEEGCARLVQGTIPETLPGTPRLVFTTRPVDDAELTIKRLVAVLYARLTPEEKAAVGELAVR